MIICQINKILVTGGSGFIGSFVVSELLKENVAEVIIFDNFLKRKPCIH